MKFKEKVITALKQSDFRITKPRKQVLDFLNESEIALTPYEMRDLMEKKGVKADVVTIYRVLEVLEQLEFVHKINSLGRFVKCLGQGKEEKCHHYLICEKCKRIQEIEGEDLSDLENKIEKLKGFKVKSHYLEFNGVCAVCQKVF